MIEVKSSETRAGGGGGTYNSDVPEEGEGVCLHRRSPTRGEGGGKYPDFARRH